MLEFTGTTDCPWCSLPLRGAEWGKLAKEKTGEYDTQCPWCGMPCKISISITVNYSATKRTWRTEK